jgi:NADPH:quinone reductase-like Zn-dependent oxidoreductase
VQIAKARGAWVAGTSSVEKHAFLRELGVDEPLDKNGPLDVEAEVVFDTVGGDAALCGTEGRPGDHRVFVVGRTTSRGRLRTPPGSWSNRTGRGLTELLAAGVRPHVEATFPLEQAAQAHELGEQGRTRGKIVLTA